jgi:hypothetical protein
MSASNLARAKREQRVIAAPFALRNELLLRFFGVLFRDVLGLTMGIDGALGGELGLLVRTEMIVHAVRSCCCFVSVRCLQVTLGGCGMVGGWHGGSPDVEMQKAVKREYKIKAERLILTDEAFWQL